MYSQVKHQAAVQEEDTMETIADLKELDQVLAYVRRRITRRVAALVTSNQQAQKNACRS